MYECPNCGGNLKFDIPSQQLACDYCGTQVSPYSVEKDEDAVEKKDFETTIFTCPQCGGELFSTDNEATSFCSFCGASTILSSRISRERRPKYIIPFKKTREDCKRAYLQKMNKALFAPKELKDPRHIEEFRGIYMPYWTYQLVQKGNICVAGEKSHREGNYIITDHYDLTGRLDAGYLGYSFDASTSFYDNISEALAPYNAKELVNFTPSFLSGFFSDTADVDENLYLEDAMELADEDCFDRIRKDENFRSFAISRPKSREDYKRILGTELRSADNTMYPVWFLAYQNKDRVAYATVNGQTGKVVADVPIDPRRYLLGSVILAVPVFLLLNLFFTFKPGVLAMISAVISLVSAVLYFRELRRIRDKELNEGDKALEERIKKKTKEKTQERAKPQTSEKVSKKKETKKKKANGSMILITVFFILFFLQVASDFLSFLPVIWLAASIASIIYSSRSIRECSVISNMKISVSPVVSIAAVLATTVVIFLHPVSDLYYYGASLFMLAAILLNFVDIIHNYSRLAMRRLPQFDQRGGAEDV